MDAYLYPRDWVEIGNRTAKKLSVMYNGVPWDLPPYPAVVRVPRIVADRAVMQHPIMGTEDPFNPRSFESLVFVRWNADGTAPMPEEPIEQDKKAIERIDRGLLPSNLQKISHEKYGRAAKPERPDADALTHFTGTDT